MVLGTWSVWGVWGAETSLILMTGSGYYCTLRPMVSNLPSSPPEGLLPADKGACGCIIEVYTPLMLCEGGARYELG